MRRSSETERQLAWGRGRWSKMKQHKDAKILEENDWEKSKRGVETFLLTAYLGHKASHHPSNPQNISALRTKTRIDCRSGWTAWQQFTLKQYNQKMPPPRLLWNKRAACQAINLHGAVWNSSGTKLPNESFLHEIWRTVVFPHPENCKDATN